VQVDENRVRVMVRDGVVRVADTHNERRLAAGLEGRLDATGAYTQVPLESDIGPWNWMLGEPARFVVEDRPLHEVLHEMSSAAGISIAWPSSELRRDAESQVLHGPALRLPPRQAIDAVLLTTRYTLREIAGADGTRRYEVVVR
jgi:hypothetical protein